MRKIVLLTVSFMFAVAAMAQDYAFKVLASKGSNKVFKATRWQDLKSGEMISQESKIKVAPGGYVGLIHKSGKPVELKSAGTFETKTLAANINQKSKGFAAKYGNYVMNGMIGADGSGKSYDVTGSVERGGDDIIPLTPANIEVIKNQPAIIRWQLKGGIQASKSGYIVEIKNLFDQTLHRVETKEFFVKLDLSQTQLKHGENYLIRITSKDDSGSHSKNKKLSLVPVEKSNAVLAELAQMKVELDPNSPLDNLVYASYFEDKGLSLYAASSLAKAVQLAPEVTDFEYSFKKYISTKQ